MRRWTGWHQPRPLRIHSDYARVRIFLPDEDARIERGNAWDYRQAPGAGWTIRTVRSNTGRTR